MEQECGKEIDITEEMQEAGLKVWAEFDREHDDPTQLIREVFCAMLRAEPQCRAKA